MELAEFEPFRFGPVRRQIVEEFVSIQHGSRLEVLEPFVGVTAVGPIVVEQTVIVAIKEDSTRELELVVVTIDSKIAVGLN